MAESIVAGSGVLWRFHLLDKRLDRFYQENLIGLKLKDPRFFFISVKSESLKKAFFVK